MKATLVIAFFLFLTPLFAQENENMKRVGDSILTKSDSLLRDIKTTIEKQFVSITSDGEIDKGDMLKLEEGINYFKGTKKRLDKRLHIFFLSTTVTLDSSYQTMVNVVLSLWKRK